MVQRREGREGEGESKTRKGEAERKLSELQLVEQSLQSFLLQKQGFQLQLAEVENALEEVGKGEGPFYKVIGGVLVKMSKEELKKDLQGKKEILDLRIKSIGKQEKSMKEKVSRLRQEALGMLKEQK